MQTHRRQRRALAALSLAVGLGSVLADVSCAEDAARVVTGSDPAPPSRVSPATTGRAPEVPSPQGSTIDVEGRVVDDHGEPLVGRGIVVVDRPGKRQEVVTDEGGAFQLANVAPPYDLLLEGGPSGAATMPLVYLGLLRRDPWLEVFEPRPADQPPAVQPLRIRVQLPPCHTSSASCWISVVSASASGAGASASSYVEGTEQALLELGHAWREPTTRPGESIEVHVLVGDAELAHYAYARVAGVWARPGEPTDLGAVAPLPIESTEPVSVVGRAAGLPEAWQWTLSTHLELPGGASLPLRWDGVSTAALRLPKLPGATWGADAWTRHPPTPDFPYAHRSAQAWTGPLPVTAAAVTLDVPLVPETSRPPREGQLSRGGQGLAWDGRVAGLASLVVVELARGRPRFRAFSAEPSLPLRRLEALGLERLERGDHVLDLTTTPSGTLDALTDPDPRARLRRFDRTLPGSLTYQRFRFLVTS